MKKLVNNFEQPQPVAVFDIDWTLLCNTSAESLLVKYLRQEKIIPFRNILKSLLFTLLWMPHGVFHSFLKNKYYLQGVEIERIRDILPAFYESFLYPALSEDLMKEMEDLRNQGYAIYLLSGTLDFIVEFLVRKLDAAGGAGSCVEIRDDKITGRILGHYPMDRGKILRLNRLLNGKKVDWEKSVAYGDSYFDIPLLSKFGNAVAVHPDIGLRKEAMRRGWRIITRHSTARNPLFRIWVERFYRKAKTPD
jgi:HAD superfamily hydrolase (TIGR01490 family)